MTDSASSTSTIKTVPAANDHVKVKSDKKPKEAKPAKELAEVKEKEPKAAKEAKEPKAAKEPKEPKPAKEAKEPKAAKEAKEPKPAKEAKEAKPAKEPKAVKEASKEVAVASESKDSAAPVEDVPASASASATDRMSAAIKRYGAWLAEGAVIRAEMKTLEKVLQKNQKAINKKAESNKNRNVNNKKRLSGFVAPTKISDELAIFLDKPLGSEMSRTEVTRELTVYIKAHSLQNPDNGRIIFPDAKLHALLGSSETDLVTYFNLQRFMKGHYIRKPVV